MASEPKYGRRDFFKDSVLSVAKAAKEYAAHADAPSEKPARLDGRIGCVPLVVSERSFWSAAPSAATV